LAPLTPADIKGGCVEAYGNRAWPRSEANPCSQQQPFEEEGDLFFMPKLMAWNAISGQGNPTVY
jgi:hypothetical protein